MFPWNYLCVFFIRQKSRQNCFRESVGYIITWHHLKIIHTKIIHWKKKMFLLETIFDKFNTKKKKISKQLIVSMKKYIWQILYLFQILGLLQHTFQKLIIHLFKNIKSFCRNTILTTIKKSTSYSHINSMTHIGIFTDNKRILIYKYFSKKILGTLPPNSRMTGVRVLEAFSMTRLPISGEPMNKTLSLLLTTADPVSP